MRRIRGSAGNLIFLGTALYTLIVAFMAWRRGSRPAGWFLVASLVFYGIPLAMVAAGILVALGVADRLREQRVALSDAERRAQARGLPIALLFIDLDHFQAINDTRGHLAGDACLGAVIARLTCSIGVAASDSLGVWGEALVARADAAVYVAKNAGRNQVHLAPPVAA